jgi:hypothetical protein
MARTPFGRGERQGINDQMQKTDGGEIPDPKIDNLTPRPGRSSRQRLDKPALLSPITKLVG